MDKSGIKTSEFWISVALFLLGIAVFIVDSLNAGSSIVGQIVGGLVSLAGVLGYTIPRAGVKKRALEAEALKLLSGLEVKGLEVKTNPLTGLNKGSTLNPS
ncbi:MAG TPA: hypothetical protein ENI05_11235 [Porticoccus sp.]|nr:hypothetical protein [Porticoccus sp.]